jgi:6-phosphofructokinase 1
MDKNISDDFGIQSLGECTIPSPINVSYFTPESKRLLFNIYLDQYNHLLDPKGFPLSVEVAGPRNKIFFDPSKTKAAIVTAEAFAPGSMTLSERS